MGTWDRGHGYMGTGDRGQGATEEARVPIDMYCLETNRRDWNVK